MFAKWRVAVLLMLQTSVSSGLQWTSRTALPDGVTIPACAGQNVTMLWSYTNAAEEHVMDLEWYFDANRGAGEEVLGTLVNGHFLSDHALASRIQYVSGAGIRLVHVVASDTGTYSVHVNINLHGSVHSYQQRVNLNVTVASVTTDGHLHASVQGARYFPGEQEHHLMLTCGTFDELWASRITVHWRTPRNQMLQSTSREHGQFLLAVPNPFEAGQYTCMIDNSSPAAVCIQSESPLLRGATVTLDDLQGRLMLSESREAQMRTQIETMLQQEAQMRTQIQTMSHRETQMSTDISQLTGRVHTLESQVAVLQHQAIFQVRLVGSGFNHGEGRVEVTNLPGMTQGSWGTVCDDGWGSTEAMVVCRHLGFPYYHAKMWGSAHFGQGSGVIAMDGLNCHGYESNLMSCPYNGYGNNDCTHSEDVGVTCFDIRLMGSTNSHEGRVEVRVGPSSYGTICDDHWDTEDAKVVCRMLGLPSGNAVAYSEAHFGQGSGPILMDDVSCGGSESHLLSCTFHSGGFGHHNCAHSEDAGVSCG